MARTYVAGVAAYLADRLCEIVPGYGALVAEMIGSRPVQKVLVQDLHDQQGKVTGICGSSDLVEYDLEGVPFSRKLPDGLDEIPAVRGIQPRGPEYDAPASGFRDFAFPEQLRGAVDSEGLSGPVFPAGGRIVPMEYIVGGNMDQGSPPFSCDPGQVTGGGAVEEKSGGRIVFRLVHVCVCGAVDDDVDY